VESRKKKWRYKKCHREKGAGVEEEVGRQGRVVENQVKSRKKQFQIVFEEKSQI
tara:strand:- start:39 stop:200 length:162 start_codon:yes stop_codon:yes gene_type:complete